LDEKIYVCNGIICKGKIRNKQDFSKTHIKKTKGIDKVCQNCNNYTTLLRKSKKQEYINSIKRNIGKCECCNVFVEKGSEQCFDFDHIDRTTKKTEVSQLIESRIEKIDKEIAKCRLLCCKCHRLKTFFEMGWNFY
jgi:hypothetical protein